ncbi:major facilitator super transporter protein [Podila epicladia]|nr:major facilitator super transporter protein [Podila epicladia]
MDDLPVLPFIGASAGTSGPDDTGSIRPRYGKVVLMLVDALRSLIDTNQALPFTALASAPTVTLPRLKALTTGTVPSFLDAILNIAESDQSSTLANQDNWIAQLARSTSLRKNRDKKQKNIGFFGDDTWIKLFPGQFFRSEGTSSFFAMDTVEVDNNVTRHVQPELAKDDWDALIFHYLGLDHVGHSGGPKSGLMQPKQAEMDAIVKTIFSALTDQQQDGDLPTLFILCGDHGMNEVGNHGGSSRSEISTAFLFMSPHFQEPAKSARIKAMVDPYRVESLQDQEEYQYYKSVSQVDLVPTISLLLGLPIPKNSVGKLIPELFDEYSDLEKLRALQINAFQVAEVLKGKWSDFETEAAALLSTYPPIDEQDQVSDEHAFETCARMDSEKQRLSCWYTEALAAHASLLEMNKEGVRIHYKDHDKVARFRAAEKSYSKFLSDSSSMLSTALSNYDMPLLTNGSLVMAFAVAGFMYCAMQTKLLSDLKRSCREPNAVNAEKSTSTIIYTSPDTAPLPSVSNFAVPKPLLKTPFASLTAGDANEIDWTLARGLSAVIFILYLVTLFASSFVEEEHQFWYFFNMSWWAVLGITSARYLVPASSSHNSGFDFKPYLAAGYCFAQMAILRILRAWNQTGQKYADQIDLRHYLNSTWIGISWIVFGAAMVTIALSLISLVYNFQQRTKQQYQEVWRRNESAPSSPGPVTTVLQALLVILVVLVTLWITLYKMDLESSYFGDQFMAQVHSIMIRISAVGYSQISALPLEERLQLTVSGFELARGCYIGLGLILVLTLTLKGLDSSLTPTAVTSSRKGAYSGALADKDAALKVVQGKPQALFVPAMILGVATLLLILLSRRHNAPIYVLFGVQLWMYTEWISLIRQRPSYADRQVSQLSNPLAEKAKSNVYVVEPLAQDSGYIAATTIAPKPAPILDLAFRTLPGQSSIHSCTALLWVLSSFFLLGNSNSIASIDISNAYVGIQAYDIFLTGVLTFVSNWAGPIWWTLATVVMMSWDLEWELAWTIEASELEHAQEEEQSWETVQGWRVSKDDKKSGMSRRTRRRVVREKKWKAASKEHEAVIAATADDGAVKVETNMIGEIAEVMPNANGVIIKDLESVEERLEVSQGEVVEENNAVECDQVEEEIEYLEEVSSDELPSVTLARLGVQGYRVHLAQTRMMEHLILSSLFFGIALYALSIAAIVLRHHLFIWTVFSPKVLYQFAWTALYQIGIQTIAVGGGVWALVLFI